MDAYKQAGVDKEAGYQAVELMKKSVLKTHNSSVLANLGGFGSLYALGDYKEPILVSGTDGVGTKLEIALKRQQYDGVGIDCVAMCVNDILCHGAQPLFFLDYLACGHLDPVIAATLVSGITEGCLQAGAALVGGETAEMPGFYKVGDYDIAGFCVGVVEKQKLIDGSRVQAGDVIVALPSSGFHSNGFSLLRKLFPDYDEVVLGKPIGDQLLTPTKIYVQPVLDVLAHFDVHGMAHITGGGLIENLPRCMGESLYPVVFKDKIHIPGLCYEAQKRGGLSEQELFGTFNMGVGFTLVVSRQDAQAIIQHLSKLGEEAYEIGYIESGGHTLCLK